MTSTLRTTLLGVFTAVISGASLAFGAEPSILPEASNHFESAILPQLVEYCAQCHDPEDDKNHVNFLIAANADDINKQRLLWRSVAAQLRNRTMPPVDESQPDESKRLELVRWIESRLKATACDQPPFAGEPVVRRLNRREYDNTIRDLVGLEFDFSDTFPKDGGGGEGFDNNGETLFLPPLLMERYVDAAHKILNAAIITPPLKRSFEKNDLKTEKNRTRASLPIYRAGEYELRLGLASSEPVDETIPLWVDAIKAGVLKLKRSKENHHIGETRIQLSRGLHTIEFASSRTKSETLRLVIEERRRPATDEQRAVHKRLLFLEPSSDEADRSRAAETMIASFASRAFRRPLKENEIAPYLSIYQRAANRGDEFTERMRLAFSGILLSPKFLFRFESPATNAKLHPVSDYELASRLSYFLWNSMPDDALLALAESGVLQRDEVLVQQVERMLRDPKSRSFTTAFANQWLGTQEVGGRHVPEVSLFKNYYTGDLAVDLREQGAQLVDYVIRENRPLTEWLASDYAFLNERIAKHYAIKGIRGNTFRKVKISERERTGVLGLGAVQVATSYPNRTSPVLRGAWVFETLLGDPIPSPPDDIPPIPKGKKADGKRTFRERLAKHREHASCAACHDLVDPIGFGLENFDAIGRWRETENDAKIDPSGVLPSGESFAGPVELQQVLLKRKDDITRQYVEKLLGYALGRSLVDGDECTIETITARVIAEDYKAAVAIREIALSTPFRYRQGSEQDERSAD